MCDGAATECDGVPGAMGGQHVFELVVRNERRGRAVDIEAEGGEYLLLEGFGWEFRRGVVGAGGALSRLVSSSCDGCIKAWTMHTLSTKRVRVRRWRRHVVQARLHGCVL